MKISLVNFHGDLLFIKPEALSEDVDKEKYQNKG